MLELPAWPAAGRPSGLAGRCRRTVRTSVTIRHNYISVLIHPETQLKLEQLDSRGGCGIHTIRKGAAALQVSRLDLLHVIIADGETKQVHVGQHTLLAGALGQHGTTDLQIE